MLRCTKHSCARVTPRPHKGKDQSLILLNALFRDQPAIDRTHLLFKENLQPYATNCRKTRHIHRFYQQHCLRLFLRPFSYRISRRPSFHSSRILPCNWPSVFSLRSHTFSYSVPSWFMQLVFLGKSQNASTCTYNILVPLCILITVTETFNGQM